MGSATTFATMIDNPASEKVFLAELNLAEQVTDWTLSGSLPLLAEDGTPLLAEDDTPLLSEGSTYAYQATYLNETITLADGSTEIIRKEISALEEDGTALTVVLSAVICDMTAGSYYHDSTNGVLYIHPMGSDSPISHTIMVFFWLYFGTKGISLGRVDLVWEAGTEWEEGVHWGADYQGRYYEPYIADRGIPQISQQTNDIHWGVSNISSGRLILLNGRGFFDQIAKKFVWTNKKIKILLGGDSLPYSQYATIFTGRIVGKTFTSRELALDLRSNSFDLLRQLPINHFWTSTYADLDPAAEGKPIPYYYGIYDSTQAPIVTCIDTNYAANTYQFKICDHAVLDITITYVDYGDGAGWQTIAHSNEDLNAATFTITSATFVLGTSRVKVAFSGKASGGIAISGAPEIVEDILLNFCGYVAADLNTASFTASKTASDCTLNVPIESELSALSIIEKICQSDLAFFDEDGDGLLRYRTWEPVATGTIPVLDSKDILGLPEIVDDIERLFYKVKVGYSYQCSLQSYLYQEATNNPTQYRHGKKEVLTVDTYLRSASNATNLANRTIWVSKEISPILRIDLKVSQIEKTLGDKLNVTLTRAPYSAAGGYVERTFEIFEKNLTCFPVQLTLGMRDLMGYGADCGYWMDTTAPDWSAATAQERDDSGFWCDANGYCDTTDYSSLNKSLWW